MRREIRRVACKPVSTQRPLRRDPPSSRAPPFRHALLQQVEIMGASVTVAGQSPALRPQKTHSVVNRQIQKSSAMLRKQTRRTQEKLLLSLEMKEAIHKWIAPFDR
jgi:hypothetical protein